MATETFLVQLEIPIDSIIIEKIIKQYNVDRLEACRKYLLYQTKLHQFGKVVNVTN